MKLSTLKLHFNLKTKIKMLILPSGQWIECTHQNSREVQIFSSTRVVTTLVLELGILVQHINHLWLELKIKQKSTYCKVSNIRLTKFPKWNDSRLVLQMSLPNLFSHVLSWEWRCSWSSADRRCSNYIWVINNLIAHKCATYIRDLTVNIFTVSFPENLYKTTRNLSSQLSYGAS